MSMRNGRRDGGTGSSDRVNIDGHARNRQGKCGSSSSSNGNRNANGVKEEYVTVVKASEDAIAITAALSDERDHEERTMDSNLEQLGFRRKQIIKDGDCLFRCFSDFLYGTSSRHMEVRQFVVDHLEAHRAFFEEFLLYTDAFTSGGAIYADDNDIASTSSRGGDAELDPITKALQNGNGKQRNKRKQNAKKKKQQHQRQRQHSNGDVVLKDSAFAQYCNKMRQRNHWGGQFELQAFSQRFNSKIVVMSSEGIVAEHGDSISHGRELLLCYSHGSHYDIAYPQTYFDAASVAQDIIYDILRDKIESHAKPSYAQLTSSTASDIDTRPLQQQDTPFWMSRTRGQYRNVEFENWIEDMQGLSEKDCGMAKRVANLAKKKKKKIKNSNRKSVPQAAPTPSNPVAVNESNDQTTNVWATGAKNWNEILKSSTEEVEKLPEVEVIDEEQLSSPEDTLQEREEVEEREGKIIDAKEVASPVAESPPKNLWAAQIALAALKPKTEESEPKTEEVMDNVPNEPPAENFPSLTEAPPSRKKQSKRKSKKRQNKTANVRQSVVTEPESVGLAENSNAQEHDMIPNPVVDTHLTNTQQSRPQTGQQVPPHLADGQSLPPYQYYNTPYAYPYQGFNMQQNQYYVPANMGHYPPYPPQQPYPYQLHPKFQFQYYEGDDQQHPVNPSKRQ